MSTYAETWLDDPDQYRPQATAYMEHACGLALKYQEAMKNR